MSKQLESVVAVQGQWSATADTLKKRYEGVRAIVFALSIAAALVAAVSSQQREGMGRTGLAMVSALCLAMVTFLSARFLDTKQAQAWARARAASEALKREAYKAAAQAAPYDVEATRDATLRTETQKIEADVDDLLDQRERSGRSSAPTDVITPDQYIKTRVEGQIAFFEKRAAEYRDRARTLRGIELLLAGTTAIITALVGFLGKAKSMNFDFVALTAVFTTLSGAILAYIEASRYDHFVSSYRATERRLRDQDSNPPPNPQPMTPAWSEFVNRCESILQDENGSWIAKFGKHP